MTDVIDLRVAQALELKEKKEVSSVELTKAYIAEMERADKTLNAFITRTPELALKQAEESDARRAKGQVGALEGIPIAHKDVFCTKGIRTTAASRILSEFVPPYESTVSEKLQPIISETAQMRRLKSWLSSYRNL